MWPRNSSSPRMLGSRDRPRQCKPSPVSRQDSQVSRVPIRLIRAGESVQLVSVGADLSRRCVRAVSGERQNQGERGAGSGVSPQTHRADLASELRLHRWNTHLFRRWSGRVSLPHARPALRAPGAFSWMPGRRLTGQVQRRLVACHDEARWNQEQAGAFEPAVQAR